MSTEPPIERVADRAQEPLSRNGSARRRETTRSVMRFAAIMAINGTRNVGRRASAGARDSVEGAMQALGAMGGETRAFVRDAVVGVVEGAGQVMTVTGPAMRDIVAGGISGSRKSGAESAVADAGRDVVAGAIVGADSVGFDDAEAITAAVEGAVEGFAEAGSEVGAATRSTIRGVVSGVAATDGDVATATRDATSLLIARAAGADPDIPKIAEVASNSVDAVFIEACRNFDIGDEVIIAAATGGVDAAYRISRPCGEKVREAVMRTATNPNVDLPPRVQRRMPHIETLLASELTATEGAWRIKAMIKSVPILYKAGGIDLAASLSFFTILSIFPLIALLIVGAALLISPDVIRVWIESTAIHYFPASSEIIEEVIQFALMNLLTGSIAFGIIAGIGIIVGANGMFRAAHRAVNRIFGIENQNVLESTFIEMIVATVLGLLFLLSIFLTAFFHTAINISLGLSITPWSITNLIAIILGVLSTLIPVLLNAFIFTVVYHHLPNATVSWRDATFGALIAIVVFEVGKHLFFWFTGLAAQRNVVYGPIASFVVLLMWTYVGGMIFLYGATLTRISGEMRPISFSRNTRWR